MSESNSSHSSASNKSNEQEEEIIPRNFGWIIPQKICAFAFPWSESMVKYLETMGMETLISLETYWKVPLHPDSPIKQTVIDVEEFEAPSKEQIDLFVNTVDTSLKEKKLIGVHCAWGNGRTGTMLACYFCKAEGLTASEAISRIRSSRPYSVETDEQVDAVMKYCSADSSGNKPHSIFGS